jgi:ribosomal protein S18 acetylase RimI-like enzyme
LPPAILEALPEAEVDIPAVRSRHNRRHTTGPAPYSTGSYILHVGRCVRTGGERFQKQGLMATVAEHCYRSSQFESEHRSRTMGVAEVEIRRLGSNDAELFRDIRLEALRCDPDAFGSTFEAESANSLSWFAGRLGTSQVLGAFDAGRLVGIAVFVVQQSAKMAHKGSLFGMFVRPEARGAGVGRRLVEAVIDTARRQVEVIQLTVVADNDAARRLYAGLGFVVYGLEKKALKQGDRYFEEILMAKDLTADQI